MTHEKNIFNYQQVVAYQEKSPDGFGKWLRFSSILTFI
jgi:hypothetical protein